MECSAERDERLMQLVSAALQHPANERNSFLRESCRDDEDLFQEAYEVLSGEQKMGSFLLHPALVFRDSPPPFHAGDVICDRFEIVRVVGEGGMGWVYEAFDRRLSRPIAIKTAKPGFQARLSPEIKGALAVSHCNICRVNEIHTTGEIDFLTMELLEGETLSDYLQSRGKLQEKEALKIARQLCSGLSEAHRYNIVHRDLKSANVILCRSAESDLRVVITDFGLAGDGTQSGDLGGTPKYVAPEIWKGQRASKASDIYSLGVILYELLAGLGANDDASNLDGIHSASNDKHAHQIASGVTSQRLPHRWARTIAQCLDPRPEKRPVDAAEVLAKLSKRSRLHLVLLPVPILLLMSLLVPGIRSRVHDAIWPAPNVRLVILPPQSSADSRALIEGALQDAADRIMDANAQQRTIAVIPPSKAAELQIRTPEQALSVLHATHALQTAIRRDGEDIIVQGAVVDASAHAKLREFSSRYSRMTMGALPGALAGEVSLALNLRGQVETGVSPLATPSYDRGLFELRLDVQNLDEALRAFEDAHQLDPRSPLPLAGMVEAELDSFDETERTEHLDRAKKYLQMAETLDDDSVRVHLAAGMLDEATGQMSEALKRYERVSVIEPRNVYAFIRIADVLDKQNRPEEALDSFRHAIELDPNLYDPHEFLGVFYFHRGNYSAAADQFQQVIALAPGMYNAYTNLGASFEKLDRLPEAEKVLQNSLALRETPRALNNLGSLLYAEQRFAESIPFLQRASVLTSNNYVVELNLGDCFRHLGNTKRARSHYRRGMDYALQELIQNPAGGRSRAFVAYFAARLGDHRRAQEEIKQALHMAPGDNTVIRRAVLTYEALGDRAAALVALEEATPDFLHNLSSDPDLAAFSQDLRFRKLVESITDKERNK